MASRFFACNDTLSCSCFVTDGFVLDGVNVLIASFILAIIGLLPLTDPFTDSFKTTNRLLFSSFVRLLLRIVSMSDTSTIEAISLLYSFLFVLDSKDSSIASIASNAFIVSSSVTAVLSSNNNPSNSVLAFSLSFASFSFFSLLSIALYFSSISFSNCSASSIKESLRISS